MNKKDIVLLIGDLIIDETHYVNINKISPEAPVPVLELNNITPTRTLGGVGMAARYAEKHDIGYGLITATSLNNISLFPEMNLYPIFLGGNNVTKTRYIDQRHGYHIVRVDNDKIADTGSPSQRDLHEAIALAKEHSNVKMVCLLNYNKGFFNEKTVKQIKDSFDVPIFVDTGTNFHLFLGCEIIRMNDIEFSCYKNQEYVYGLDTTVIVTCGKEGAKYYAPNQSKPKHIPIGELDKQQGIPDTTGCGDVFDISFCDCFMRNYDLSLSNEDLIDMAVKHAVSASSKFAHEDFKTRLNK